MLTVLKSDPELAAIPVVMQTMLADRQKAFALGAADYLVKPVERQRLVDTVGRLTAADRRRPVLVVDDDAEVREVVRRALERLGVEVLEAADGRQALALVASHDPQLVLLDLMMPELDGFGFLEELRRDEAHQDLPVVVLTAKDLSEADRRRLYGAVHAILEKGSYGASRLLEEIRPLIR